MKERRALRGMPRYLWWALVATALHLAAPSGSARAALHLGLSLAATGATLWGIHRWRPRPSLPWLLVVAALATGTLGDLARMAGSVQVPGSAADLTGLVGALPGLLAGVDLVTALLVGAAAASFLMVRRPERRWQAVADVAVVVLAPALLVLAASTLALGALVDLARLAAGAAAASLALPPSMRELVEPVGVERPAGPARLALLGLALLSGPALALARALGGGWRGVSVAVGVGLLSVGVLARTGALLAERELAKATHRSADQRFRALVQHAFDVIAVVDADGVIAYISPSAQELLGRVPAWWVGRRLDDLVGAEDVEVLHDALAVARTTAPAVSRAEVRLNVPAAETRWCDVLLADRIADPGVGGIVVNLRDVTERKRAELELGRLALHDALTGLPNRVRFLERVARALDHGGRRQNSTAVLFCDLDGFKAVNDRYGHDLGDRLLRAVAERLRETLRDDDEAARLGGDEFVVLCTGVDGTQAEAIAQRVRAYLEAPFALRGLELRVGCSIGIATAEQPGVLPEELLAAADHAMYRAKQLGTGVELHRWGHPDLPGPLLVEADLLSRTGVLPVVEG